jgi:hypothetical protein
MTPAELLHACQSRGIRLSVVDGALRYRAPGGALTPDLRAALQVAKPALVRLLQPVTEFVTLNGGLTIPVPALQLALDLEARGISLATDGEHRFVVPDDPRLTSHDQAAIARWRLHLGAIVEYRVPEVA